MLDNTHCIKTVYVNLKLFCVKSHTVSKVGALWVRQSECTAGPIDTKETGRSNALSCQREDRADDRRGRAAQDREAVIRIVSLIIRIGSKANLL